MFNKAKKWKQDDEKEVGRPTSAPGK